MVVIIMMNNDDDDGDDDDDQTWSQIRVQKVLPLKYQDILCTVINNHKTIRN